MRSTNVGAGGAVVEHGKETSGLVFTTCSLPPQFHLPDHAHRRATLLVVLGGEYIETVGGRSHAYPSMSAIAKPPGQEHSNQQGGRRASCLAIEITDRRLDGLRQHADLFERRVEVRGGPIGTLGLRAAKELAAPDDLTALVLEGLALEMFAEASRRERTFPAPTRLRWLDQVRQMLDDSTSAPALSAIAQAVDLHPVYMARAFREHFHCTMGDYARRRRIERAQAALSASNEAVVTIALKLGFCDQSHFSKSFRRHTGMSPVEFRSAHSTNRSG